MRKASEPYFCTYSSGEMTLPRLLLMRCLLYTSDSVIAGKFISVDALAAVGASYPITMIFLAIGTGAGVGGSVIISQLFGGKDHRRMLTAISTALIAISVLGVILTVLGAVFCDDLMRLLDTPSNVFADGSLYLRIYIWGLLFLFLYNM